jgi:CMP-N-acetylneuraminic acid synthetase
MSEVGVFSFGRRRSQRCPDKMLRPFGDTTLTDLVLSKLARLPGYTFFAGEDDEFRRKCDEHKVKFVARDARSLEIDEPIVDILSFLRDQPCEHFLCVNACLPFLRVETVGAFLEDCLAHDRRPAFSVVRRRNFFMTLDQRPLNFDTGMKTINTKAVQPVYEFVHGLYFFARRYFFQQGRYWDWATVRLVELPSGAELLDVDTEEDFALAEAVWRSKGGVSG